MEKLTAGQITVSDQEVADYISKNKATLTATDESGMQAEARNILMTNKSNQILRQYFTDLKAKAKVTKFL